MLRLTTAPADLAIGATHLLAGDLVIVPTETVYGAAVLAENPAAVAKLLAAKERPPQSALPVLAPHLDAALSAFAEGPAKERARALGARFWPGPLTVVAPISAALNLPPEALARGTTIGVRVPGHAVTRALLDQVGRLLCCPSSNCSGNPPATAAASIDPEFLARVDVIIDGGDCGAGLASTVVDVSSGCTILRSGPISREALVEELERSAR